jgi:hypothetical protein
VIELSAEGTGLVIAVMLGILEIRGATPRTSLSDCLEHWTEPLKKSVVTSGAPGNA